MVEFASKMIQGVIFDMDGVLCDSEPFICEAAVAMFRRRYQTQVHAADFLPFTGMGEDRFLGGVAAKYGLKLNIASDKVFTYQIYLDLIQGRLSPLHGAVEFIVTCRARGLSLAVASSADRMKVAGNLAQLGLADDIFEVVVDGSMVARKKPEPDIFLLAAQRMAVAPAHCLVFEDAVAGIQAACAAGMRAVGVCSSFSAAALVEAGACATVADLSEAAAVLDVLQKKNKF